MTQPNNDALISPRQIHHTVSKKTLNPNPSPYTAPTGLMGPSIVPDDMLSREALGKAGLPWKASSASQLGSKGTDRPTNDAPGAVWGIQVFSFFITLKPGVE